jgi:hypothetical protein
LSHVPDTFVAPQHAAGKSEEGKLG